MAVNIAVTGASGGQTQNISFYQGTDVIVTVTVTGVNITGFSLGSDVRRHRNHRGAPAIVGGCNITDGANGVFTVTFADNPGGANALIPATYYWAAKRTDAGHEDVYCEGTCTLKETAVGYNSGQ